MTCFLFRRIFYALCYSHLSHEYMCMWHGSFYHSRFLTILQHGVPAVLLFRPWPQVLPTVAVESGSGMFWFLVFSVCTPVMSTPVISIVCVVFWVLVVIYYIVIPLCKCNAFVFFTCCCELVYCCYYLGWNRQYSPIVSHHSFACMEMQEVAALLLIAHWMKCYGPCYPWQ